jgi:hypothetical protein
MTPERRPTINFLPQRFKSPLIDLPDSVLGQNRLCHSQKRPLSIVSSSGLPSKRASPIAAAEALWLAAGLRWAE